MGGQGSGRKPSEETIVRRQYEQKTPICNTGESVFLPNFSAVKPALKETRNKINTDDLEEGTTNLYFTDARVTSSTHAADTSDPHGATITQTNIISSGIFSGSTIKTTADFVASGSEVMRNILIGTEETPPTASGYTQGTLYIQYTA